jgi:3-oxoacyl-[acyl-carrier protein] reductase|tara:strand:+ start:133 stop:876 length:744 start_codon:yes stop_codon:yes gene_type:complete
MLLKNKVAVVTGCSQGIGNKIVETFSRNNAKVFACVRKINDKFLLDIKKIAKENKTEVIPIELDFNSEDSIKEASTKILSQAKIIDILVNNAGIIHTANFQMTSHSKLKEIFEINFFSQNKFTQYICKPMIKNKKGNIIYISSTSGIDGNHGRSAYSSSKAAIISQSKALSRELGIINIRVNTIAPGLTDTSMMKNNTSEEIINNVVNNLSLKRVGKTSEIANVALFLASDLSSYITGQTIRVDGGM